MGSASPPHRPHHHRLQLPALRLDCCSHAHHTRRHQGPPCARHNLRLRRRPVPQVSRFARKIPDRASMSCGHCRVQWVSHGQRPVELARPFGQYTRVYWLATRSICQNFGPHHLTASFRTHTVCSPNEPSYPGHNTFEAANSSTPPYKKAMVPNAGCRPAVPTTLFKRCTIPRIGRDDSWRPYCLHRFVGNTNTRRQIAPERSDPKRHSRRPSPIW